MKKRDLADGPLGEAPGAPAEPPPLAGGAGLASFQAQVLQDGSSLSASAAPTGMALGLIVGASLGGVALLVLIVVIVSRKLGHRKALDLDFDEVGGHTSKSAPSTRNSSPKLPKRGSLTSTHSSSSQKALLMRSLTADMIPDFELPPERVQPRAPGDKRGPTTALQFQHSLIDSLQADCGGIATSAEDDTGEGSPSPSGRVWFSLIYDAAVEELTVNLVKAKHLKPRDKNNTPRDPFVKLYLLPDERMCQESRVRKKTLSPKFNENFTFKIAAGDVASRTLRLSVYDVDKRRVRHSLGHVIVSIGDVDLTRGDVMWRDLEQMSQSSTALGDVNISLGYTPNTEKLKVAVLRARNLRKVDYEADTEVYIRVQLMHGQKVHKTKKTSPQRGTCEPVYNESFSFTVPSKQIDNCYVVVTLMVSSAGRLGQHEEEYGRTTVGSFMYARGEELMHWQEVLAQPRSMVSRWHQLTTESKPAVE